MSGIGDGNLSEAARLRLARGIGDPPLSPPDPGNLAAVAAWRTAVHAAWGEGTVAGEVAHHSVVIGGVPCLTAGDPALPVVVYVHGGGYALGSPGVAVPITARLAGRVHVVSVDYRLAPEHRWSDALADVAMVYRHVSAAAPPVALAGDSAGGALAVAVALTAAAHSLPPPSALVLLCPHLDHGEATGRAERREGTSSELDVRRYWPAYRGDTPPEHPLLSPVRASLSQLAVLPPTLVQSGTLDPLLDHAIRFVRRARAAGVDATLDVWEGLWHTWQYHRDLPEADHALDEAARFLDRRTAT